MHPLTMSRIRTVLSSTDSPKEGILAAWSTLQHTMRPYLARDVEIYAPFVRGPILHIRCPSGPASSRYLVAALRQHVISVSVEVADWKLYSLLQESPDIRARNKRLMCAAATIQDSFGRYLHTETYKTACSRSSTRVIMGNRVCSVTRTALEFV